ncbi:TPA: DUF1629 domain-containing protein [Stenotrophomonas maltophilia]|nr:DUF1629 domain-containing protein [Stenotrophomonas maltophilia]HDS1025275.1 DUF1629 domain-containing protein [Stenotrophomonas maltophilia]HDS1029528.1 DUF1629 domain-containing protein [Stenotrophomonas maltophilia]HDS1034146.1 DUF1629 domain-containing protein [Stenotrophomonas maltophilia]
MKDAIAPTRGKFYLARPDTRSGGRGRGVVLDNKRDVPLARHLSLPAGSGGLSASVEIPRLRYDHLVGDMPQDLEGGFKGYWLVSMPLKRLLESMDPTGFLFRECVFTLEDGSAGEDHFLCEVVRTLDAIDESASNVRVLQEGYPNGKFYDIAGGASLAFREDVVAGSHVFRTPFTADVYCDRAMRDALIESGYGVEPATRGVWLTDAAELYSATA